MGLTFPENPPEAITKIDDLLSLASLYSPSPKVEMLKRAQESGSIILVGIGRAANVVDKTSGVKERFEPFIPQKKIGIDGKKDSLTNVRKERLQTITTYQKRKKPLE